MKAKDELIDGLLGILIIGGLIMATLIVLPLVFWPSVPEPSPTFDCDDSTLLMYHHFTDMGVECIILAGNLEMTGESYKEVNHVWLLVKVGHQWRPYDWGYPCSDRQHLEGYPISYELLKKISARDK